MPELPEVETIRRQLVPALVGREVTRADLRLPRLLEVGSRQGMARLKGHRFLALRRHGKYLLCDLGRGDAPEKVLLVHLGMTGQLTFHPAGQVVSEETVTLVSGYQKSVGVHPIDKHTHLVLELGEDRLYFRDPRTFGKLLVLDHASHRESPRLARLGPDALGLDLDVFVERLWARRGRRQVKSILLDQGFIAGVGNIYADEACYSAGVKPQRRSQRLTRKEAGKLAEAVDEALTRGITNSGTSFSDYVGADGHPGSNQETLHVYGRGGEPCVRCGEELIKGVVAQRGTVWCRRCQR
jgi:formamidopyrimidine-DNA glycosylase